MQSNLLTKVKILDLTHRLPGPLASSELANYGADVSKLELKEDPFENYQEEEVFRKWYKNFNQSKKRIKELEDNEFDLVISPYNSACENFIQNKVKAKAVIYLHASQNKTPFHDLNLSVSYLGFNSTPSIPVAGAIFAMEIKSIALATLLNGDNTNSTQHLYFDEVVKSLAKKFALPYQDDKLHMGKYPSYNVYKLKTGESVAFAAIEEHFWLKFLQISGISLLSDDRFDTTGATKEKLISFFGALSLEEFNEKIANQNICVTVSN